MTRDEAYYEAQNNIEQARLSNKKAQDFSCAKGGAWRHRASLRLLPNIIGKHSNDLRVPFVDMRRCRQYERPRSAVPPTTHSTRTIVFMLTSSFAFTIKPMFATAVTAITIKKDNMASIKIPRKPVKCSPT